MSTIPAQISWVLVDGASRRTGAITHSPFTVGRLPENDLVLSHPWVSRQHAEFVVEDGNCYIVDRGSRHGTFVNGKLAQPRQRIDSEDKVQFGALDGPTLRLAAPGADMGSTIRDIISQIPEVGSGSGLEKLRWFFESARKLKTYGAVDQILSALLETTLQLTHVERGYVFLRNEAGQMELAVGRDTRGAALIDDGTLSHGAIHQAVSTSSEYILTDTLSADPQARSASIVAHSIRTVICIPLRKHRLGVAAGEGDLLGLLYLDSRLKAGSMTQIDNDLLRTIATDAAALLDNAKLAIAEESERRYREELNIAAEIQRGLMTARMPDLPWAQVSARSVPCREVGGDFFDVLDDGESVSIVVADISGKGISAAILASNLQGLLYSHLAARRPLPVIAEAVNRYICGKNIGKYATLAILRLSPGGELEYINCGHVPPYLFSSGCERLREANLPVGLIENAAYQSQTLRLEPGARVLVVTDGVTESQSGGAFFGEDRLATEEMAAASLDEICGAVQNFAGSLAAEDDCTLVDLRYLGHH